MMQDVAAGAQQQSANTHELAERLSKNEKIVSAYKVIIHKALHYLQ